MKDTAMECTLLKRNDGIALVTSLLLTLISLTMVLALMLMIQQSIQASGATKRYKSAVEAAYGGTQIVTKDIFPLILQNMATANLISSFSNINLQVPSGQTCLQAKLTTPTSAWPSGCDSAVQAKSNPDISITLSAASGNPYTVYSKIVDTVKGNTDTSGFELDTHSVAEILSVVTPQHLPYLYRIEIQGERSTTAAERSNLTVLYAY